MFDEAERSEETRLPRPKSWQRKGEVKAAFCSKVDGFRRTD